MGPRGPLVALGALGILILAAGTASAAAPAYCALYAREYAIDTVQPQAAAGMLQSVQDQAYYRCLNQDDDPPLPQQSAYFGGDINASLSASGQDSASDPVSPPLPTPRPAQPAAPPAPPRSTTVAAKAPVVTASNQSTAGYRPSGLTAWTPEWQAWCQRNFPNSWDPKTGTIQHFGSDTRELCQ